MTAVVIGGGHNGLAAAFYLAKAGIRPIVLERQPHVGGGAVTGEIHPGFRCPTLSHDVSSMRADIVRDMGLERYGLQLLQTPVRACALDETRAIALYRDPRRSAESLRSLSASDAGRLPEFAETIVRLSSVVAALFEAAPPDMDHPSAGDLWSLLQAGVKFRALGKRDGFTLLRWAPMPVADLVREWFESELLCAAIAARGLSGGALGPRSAGSGLLLLLSEAHRRAGIDTQVRGGPGELTRAMARSAVAAGAEIRTSVSVERILVDDDKVVGVRLENGTEIGAAIVVSSLDPRTTFLRLVDPLDLMPEFAGRMQHYRSAGTVAKINLALSGLPQFSAAPSEDVLGARIHMGPTLDYLERAFDHTKYGGYSEEPWLDVRIPSILDCSLAPAGGHVMSLYAHHAPYRLRNRSWAEATSDFRTCVMRVLKRHAPGIEKLIVAEQILLPEDLERDYGFGGGHIFHGELSIDQLFTMRPVLGHADYRTPISGLYLCGAGTHPGGFLTGQSGRLAARAIANR